MKIAVIGFGSRGTLHASLYGKDATLVAVCDIKPDRLELARRTYGLGDDCLYSSDDEFFKQGKLADLLVVSTPDACHCKHAIAALELGYDLQLEKPIACTEEDCRKIYETAKRLNRKVFVCHVLRYAPFFSEIKRELDTGAYGKPITINLTENVCYWHQAHSYVRGNWRDSETSSPMIIAKCCHDLDLIAWFMESPCISVSSMGSLSVYKRENAPANSAERCVDCPVKDDCAYNAEKFYLGRFDAGNKGWPGDVLTTTVTRENLEKAIKEGPYGRCVYKCDNNVVDHQVVNMQFENGATAHLTMTAFSDVGTREIHVHCEKGDIRGRMSEHILTCSVFGKSTKTIDTAKIADTGFGHGGGDTLLVRDIIAACNGTATKGLTTIDHSMISHFMGFAAESSRLAGGKVTKVEM